MVANFVILEVVSTHPDSDFSVIVICDTLDLDEEGQMSPGIMST